MAMAIDLDNDLEREFTETCREMGLSPSEAFAILARAVVHEHGIPSALSAGSTQERAMHASELSISDGIAQGIADMKSGDVVSREESRAMRVVQRKDA